MGRYCENCPNVQLDSLVTSCLGKDSGTWVEWAISYQAGFEVREVDQWQAANHTTEVDADAVSNPQRPRAWPSTEPGDPPRTVEELQFIEGELVRSYLEWVAHEQGSKDLRETHDLELHSKRNPVIGLVTPPRVR